MWSALPARNQSVVEAVQRWIGRQLRAVVRREKKVLLEVPPKRLDTIRIISHEENAGIRHVVAAGINFVQNMRDALADTNPRGFDRCFIRQRTIQLMTRAGSTCRRDRDSPCHWSAQIRNNEPIDATEFVDDFGRGMDKPREKPSAIGSKPSRPMWNAQRIGSAFPRIWKRRPSLSGRQRMSSPRMRIFGSTSCRTPDLIPALTEVGSGAPAITCALIPPASPYLSRSGHAAMDAPRAHST